MSFSTATCLTYTGNTQLGGTFNVYSNLNYSNIIETVKLSGITGNNCPYYFTVPDGTTSIRLIDTLTLCYVDIPISSKDLCTTCDLNFTNITTNNVGRISVGRLTGDCQNNITDYKILWYGPDSLSNVGYTSGYGTGFTYQFTHPLTGTSAIFAYAGEYVPVVDSIKISGLTFSRTGTTGSNVIQANLECFDPVVVQPFICSNGGNSDDINYTHQVNFLSAAAGVTPQPLSSTFNFTGITNYFAWKFRGFDVSDTLKISYVGSAYPVPIVLEYIKIGTDAGSQNLEYNVTPKIYSTNGFYNKVTTLTQLTRNPGDYLLIEVTPNQSNSQTTWNFYFTCLDTFDCNLTPFEQYKDQSLKILKSSIRTQTGSCDTTTIYYKLTGDTTDNDFINTDYYRYLGGSIYVPIGYETYVGDFSYSLRSCSGQGGGYGTSCNTPSSNTIRYEKYITGGLGEIKITCSDYNDLVGFYNQYKSIIAGNVVSEPEYLGYYRYAELFVPNVSGSQNCGDGVGSLSYQIHTSAIATTGITGSDYYVTFTMPTISNQYTGNTSCANCNSTINYYVGAINTSSTGVTNNIDITSTVGSRYQYPFRYVWYINLGSPYVTTTRESSMYVTRSNGRTYAYSGNSYTFLPSLTGRCCNFEEKFGYPNSMTDSQQYVRYLSNFKFSLINPSDNRDFEIYASPITNYVYSGYPSTSYYKLVYQYSGGTEQYYDSDYIKV